MFDPYYKWLGIPPEDQPPHHYRLLGISLFESDPDVIANAAEQRMAHVKQYQAGQHSLHSQEILNQLATAKVCLLNADKKAIYDGQLRRELSRRIPSRWTALWASLLAWRPDWRAIWDDDRVWQAISTVSLVFLLAIGAAVWWRARASAPESAPRAQATARQPASSRPVESGGPTTAKPAAPAAPVSVTSSSSASIRLGPAEGERERGSGREAAVPPVPPAADRPADVAAGLPRVEAPPERPAPTPRPATARAAVSAARSSVPPESPPAGDNAPKPRSGPVYLDDLREITATVGWGRLGKHGATGYPTEHDNYGPRAVLRGVVPEHALSMHPPEKGTAFASYGLTEDYRTFRATVGLLEVDRSSQSPAARNPFFTGEAYSPLTFRVVGNGKVLWQSRAVRRSGDWLPCSVNIEGVRLLELQVDCPGSKTFAWAAWVEPLVEP